MTLYYFSQTHQIWSIEIQTATSKDNWTPVADWKCINLSVPEVVIHFNAKAVRYVKVFLVLTDRHLFSPGMIRIQPLFLDPPADTIKTPFGCIESKQNLLLI